MTAGMFGYVVNDAFIKRAAEDLPLFQAVFLRGLVAITVLTTIVRVQRATAPLAAYLDRPLLLRMSMEALGTIVYLITLTQLPDTAFAGLTAVLQLLPIAVTFAAARIMREQVSLHRVGALLVGFIGVLFVVQPGTSGFSPWFIGGFVAVLLILIRELATRKVSPTISGPAAALGTAVTIATMGGIITLFVGWERPAAGTLALITAGACFLSLGYVASVNSMRTGDVSFTAPFRYTILIFAILVQIVVFGEVPDAMTFVGSGIIAAAGFYTLAKGASPVRSGRPS